MMDELNHWKKVANDRLKEIEALRSERDELRAALEKMVVPKGNGIAGYLCTEIAREVLAKWAKAEG